METRAGRLTDAFLVGLHLRKEIRNDQSLCEALQTLDVPFDQLKDSYPEWHPVSYPFAGMLKLFLYREITGESYRSLAQYPELGVRRWRSNGLVCVLKRDRMSAGFCTFHRRRVMERQSS